MNQSLMRQKGRKLECYLLSAPALILYTAIFIYPMINLFFLSFFRWNGIPSSPKVFVGFDNFLFFINDPKFSIAAYNVGVFILSGFILILPAAFFLAHVAMKSYRFNRFLRASYFMPQVISRTAIALMWYFLLYPQGGPVIMLFRFLQLDFLAFNYLGSMTFAIYMITIINAWTYAGFNMLLLSAGLTAIPDEIHEAASIDGANALQRFMYITFPMMHQTLQIFTISCIVGSITTFEMVWTTTQGGPGKATEVFGTILYKNAFFYSNFGSSNAIGVFLLLSSILGTILLTRFFELTNPMK